MKRAELTSTGLRIEREEKINGRSFIILGSDFDDMTVLVRQNEPDEDHYFIINLYRRDNANKKLDWFMSRKY